MTIPLFEILYYGSSLVASFIVTVCIFMVVFSEGLPKVRRSKKEESFIDPNTGKAIAFPSIDDEPSVKLSVIVPAYNEENRLPPMLKECVEVLEARAKDDSNFTYEVIVVVDGGSDGTAEVANQYSKKLGSKKVRVLDLETNRGKGGAVRLGMQSARGSLLLFADADGATKFADISKLESSISELTGKNYLTNPKEASEKLAIAIGSRAHLEKEAVASRSFFRTILMYGFHSLVWLFAVRGLKDTQCGFKLFTRKAAKVCFESIHVERWAFDVELLYIAQALDIPIAEVAVNWTEIEGSKLVPIWSWVQMGNDLILIWLRYFIGAWKIKALRSE